MSKKNYHKGAVREGLIEMAEQVLQDEGLAALSLRRVAREVGVAPSAVYNHFKNREALLAAVAADGYDRLQTLEINAYRSSGDPETRLRQLARDYLRFAARNRSLYRLMFSRDVVAYRSHQEPDQAGDTSFRAAVEWWYGKGSYDPDKTAVHYPYALSVWSMVHGAAMQMIDGLVNVDTNKTRSINTLADTVVGVLISGVRQGLPEGSTAGR